MMKFRVIEGGLSCSQSGTLNKVSISNVAYEGRRRLNEIGYEKLAVREQLTGMIMPENVKRFRLQVDYVVSVLSRLDPIPSDFNSDIYWPTLAAETRMASNQHHPR
jgi:hypothetical protein